MQGTEKLTVEFFDDINGLLDTIKEQANTITQLKAENKILREKYDAILTERIDELKERNDELMCQLDRYKEGRKKHAKI